MKNIWLLMQLVYFSCRLWLWKLNHWHIKSNSFLAKICDLPRNHSAQCNFRGLVSLLAKSLKAWIGVGLLTIHLGLRHIASEVLEFFGDSNIRQQEIDWVRKRRRKEGFI